MPCQVTEISNVKCVTRLPKETKRQAVAIIFTDAQHGPSPATQVRGWGCRRCAGQGPIGRGQSQASLLMGCEVWEEGAPQDEVGRQAESTGLALCFACGDYSGAEAGGVGLPRDPELAA